MRDLSITSGAHPANYDDLLRAFEKTMFTSMCDDPRGKCRANAGQSHQFLDGGGIDIDLSIKQYEDAKEITKKTK